MPVACDVPSGQEGECRCVLGTDDAEVTVVESSDAFHSQALGHGDHRYVDCAKREVGVLQDKLAHALQVSRGEVD